MEDTIAAISTPPGEGGIGIIRISGPESYQILEKVFVRPGSSKELENRKLTYGHIVDKKNGEKIDEVLAVIMRGPKTYTAEDVVEIDCHGGLVPLRRTLELVLKNGARPAERGEFTQRAFLNGRLDLSQAEAVMDMISAKADKTFDVAINQLAGGLSEEIGRIRHEILDFLVELTVNIDYPDEDIEELTYSGMEERSDKVIEDIDSLIQSSAIGRVISEGLNIAIIGKPNVGKSSLMNSLLKEARAIVTEIPGTTRDTIQESLNIRGIPLILTDTAGIRETEDKIETIGIEKSKQSFNDADLVIYVVDSSRELSSEDFEIIDHIDSERTMAVFNKIDLETRVSVEDIKTRLPGVQIIETSMRSQDGIDVLEDAIYDRVYSGKTSDLKNNLMITNARHKVLLESAYNSMMAAKNLISQDEPLEIVEIDVKEAYDNLGGIIGESVSEDILDEVFSRFCLGK